jgi:hypothetical protein
MNDLDMDDRELLTEYATRNSEDAFRTLVERLCSDLTATQTSTLYSHSTGSEDSP